MKPRWLSARYAPKIDDSIKILKTDYPVYAKAGNPIEWLRRLYWCGLKANKATYVIDPSDDFILVGPGDLDTFKYLKHYCDKHY